VRVETLHRRLGEGSLAGDGRVSVRRVTHDWRRLAPGVVFAALPGERAHGLDDLKEALAAGAAAILTDRPPRKTVDLPWITVSNPRSAMARAAWILAGNPQRKLQLIAVTGTNEKSTTAHLIGLLLQSARKTAAFIGGHGARLPGNIEIAVERATPETTELAPILKHAVRAGATAAVIEVSSRALGQDGLAGLEFDIAVWTDLTRDHLDDRRDMEAYFASKRRLFAEHLAAGGRRVLPVDDPWGARLLDEPHEGDVSWGLDRGAVCARNVVSNLEGSRFDLNLPEREISVNLPLVGVHYLRSAIAAAAAAHAAGLSAVAIRRGLDRARPLPGRMERIKTNLPFPVFIDSAHTPAGLRSVLQALTRITDRRLIVVFGASGARDHGQRGPIGFAVGESADVAVVTSGAPSGRNPERVADEVADGVRAAGAELLVVIDRREAIARALEIADGRSLVLVAGTSGGTSRAIADTGASMSDREVLRVEARRALCA